MGFDANAFAAGQAAAGNGVQDMLGNQVAQLQAQRMQLGNVLANQQMAMQRIALQRQQNYSAQVQSFAQNPTVEGLSQLWAYPEFQANTKGIYDAMDPRMRQQEATQVGSVVALLQNGQNKDGSYDPKMVGNAIQLVQRRLDADKAAGRDTSNDEQALSMLQSGDPRQINAVKAMGVTLIAGAAGFDKAKDFLTPLGLDQSPITLSPGQSATNPVTGAQVANQPANLTAEKLALPGGGEELVSFNPNPGGAGGSSVASTQAEGGGPASAGGDEGFTHAVATVLHNEGGWNPADMNGSPTMMGLNLKANPPSVLAKYGVTDPKKMTPAQASAVYYDRYWKPSGAANLPANMQTPYFDVYVRNPGLAKKALAQSGGDPAQFMAIAQNYFGKLAQTPKGQKYAQAWANRDANNVALATGSAPTPNGAPNSASAPVGGTPGPGGSTVLASTGTPGAAITQGAPQGYQWNADHTGVIPLKGSETDPTSYSPQEIDDLARNWIATGPTAFASLGGGMGGGGIAQLKKAALARATAIMAANGISADQLPAIRSKFSGLNTAMTDNQKVLSMLEASENALHSNAQQVLATQKRLMPPSKDNPDGLNIIDNGSPFLNKARLKTYEQIGSADTKAAIKSYLDAVNGLSIEYTKFMNSASGMGGNAAPSDSSRELAQDLNDEGQGPASMNAHIKQIFIETSNKRGGIEAQNNRIQTQLSSLLGERPGNQGNGLPQGAKVIGTYKGRRVIEVNGQRLVEQ